MDTFFIENPIISANLKIASTLRKHLDREITETARPPHKIRSDSNFSKKACKIRLTGYSLSLALLSLLTFCCRK